VGQIEWLLYGSGHVHGLQHNGNALIDFERDALHRETGRTLLGQDQQGAPGALKVQRRWDALGRLQGLATQGLQGAAQLPQVLIGQLSQRQYHYDALGQLTAVQTPAETLRYGYDAAGRLRAMQQGQQQQRWNVDPAGNRLPQPLAPGQAPEADWASQVHAHWKQQDFNLLGQAEGAASGTGAVTRWPDNRIGFTDTAAWRYDAQGNRVEQLRQDGQRQQLIYDGANQLIEVSSQGPTIGQQAAVGISTSRYVYDALGRRLKKRSASESGQASSYYGWDGDRLIHTEHTDARKPEQRQITHTVYEPGSFTPLVQLSTAGEDQSKPQVLALMAGDEDDDSPMARMLDALPSDMRQALDHSLHLAMHEGIPAPMQALMGEDQSQNTLQRLTGLREQLEKQEQTQQTPITVRHYHCDHLGTPLALTDQNQQIVWAARLDPWGNVEQEFNPHDIEQSIRLPGQHHDKETGLYYNRHRYYDPHIGSYVNQDPIDLRGGANLYRYANNSLSQIDSTGLNAVVIRGGLNGARGGAALGAYFGPIGAAIGGVAGAIIVAGVAWYGSKKAIEMLSAKTPEQLSADHQAAANDRTKPGYGGNCTPDEHDDLKRKQESACDKSKSLTCAKPEIDYGKAELIQECIDARINIARKCFAGGDDGHNQQINQLKAIIGKCTGHRW
jgi:RHS repeat-associated protein